MKNNKKGWWNSDGTSEGTVLLRDMGDRYLNDDTGTEIVDIDGTAYLMIKSEGAFSLWKSDGFPVGTKQVMEIKGQSLT